MFAGRSIERGRSGWFYDVYIYLYPKPGRSLDFLIVSLELRLGDGRYSEQTPRFRCYSVQLGELCTLKHSRQSTNGRRAILLPFMQDGDNFFTRMDQQQQLEKEQREQKEREDAEAAEAAKLEAAKLEAAKIEAAKLEAAKLEAAKLEAAELEAARVKAAEKKAEAERSRHRATAPPNRDDQGGGSSRGSGNGMDGRARATVPPEEERPPPALPLPREVEANPLDDIDFKAIPADPMTVAETLVKVRGGRGVEWRFSYTWGRYFIGCGWAARAR